MRRSKKADDEMTEPSCPEVVGSLAFGLHMQRSVDLKHEVPVGSGLSGMEGADYSVVDGVIRYASIEARNSCAAQFVYEENQAAFENTPSQWIHLAFKMWRCEITNEDKASGRLLSYVNRAHDVFSLAAEVIKSGELRTYDVLHVVEAALPHLDEVNLDGLIQLCVVQHESTNNDSMAGMFYNGLESILIDRSDYCLTLHRLIHEEPHEETQGLYQTALSALVRSGADQGIKLLRLNAEGSNVLLKNAATWATGLLLSRNHILPDQIKDAEDIVLKNISSEVERVRNSAIEVAGRCLVITKAFDDVLEGLAEKGDQAALCAIAGSLFFNFKEMKDKPLFEKWARSLSKIDPENRGGIDNFDYVLSHLIEDASEGQLAIEILSDWVVHHGRNVPRDKTVTELLGSASNAIIQKPELISQVITDWYLDSDTRLAAAAAGLLAEMSLRKIKEVVFDTERLDTLDQGDLMLLARRMLGYLSDEDHLFSLTNSLLNTENAKQRTFGLVLGLFVNELGEDYLGSAIEFLESKKGSESDPGRVDLYSKAIHEISTRIDELENLPRLQEFYPSGELEKGLFKARAKQMNTAMEEGSKGSIVEMIATKIPIKGGKGWFSHRDGSYSDPSYLQSFSTQISIPRRCVTDEVGHELHGLMLRNAQKGDG